MSRDQVAALLLAAGASSRLGHAKQLLTDTSGMTAVVRMARALRDAGCTPVVVVLGAHATEVAAALTGEAVHLVTNDRWREGMGGSIAAGITALAPIAPDAQGVVICPCDMPTVSVAHLRALCAAFDGRARVASTYGAVDTGETVRGIPAILPRTDWPWLSALTGDAGARPLLRDAHTRTVALPGGEFDLDTPADLVRWHRLTAPPPGDASLPPEPR